MNVIVTRAEPGASDTIVRLVGLGHEALPAPMLRIETSPAPIDLGGAQGLIFTSANGVRAFAAISDGRARTAWCVGEATAEAAHRAGFTSIMTAGGDLVSLAELIATRADSAGGRLLHIAGADLAGDLAGALRARGYDVVVHTAYRAMQATSLPAPVAAALAASQVDAILFHSARGAAAFVSLTKGSVDLDRIAALCLSEAVAKAARTVSWRQIHVAAAPRESDLLALLGRADLRSDSGQKDC